MCRGPGTGVFIPPAVLAQMEAAAAPGHSAPASSASTRDKAGTGTPRLGCCPPRAAFGAAPQFGSGSFGALSNSSFSWSDDELVLFAPPTPAGLAPSTTAFGSAPGSARSSFDAAPYVSAPLLAVSAGPCAAELPLGGSLTAGAGAWLLAPTLDVAPALGSLALAGPASPSAAAGAPASLLGAQLAAEQELQAIDAALSELLAQKEALQRTRMQARSCAASTLGCTDRAGLAPEPLLLCMPQQQLQPATAAYVQAAAGVAGSGDALAASMEAVAAHNKLEELMAMQQLQLVLQQELLQLLPLAG